MIAKNEGIITKVRMAIPDEYGPTEIFVLCKGDSEESFLKSFYGEAYDLDVEKLVGNDLPAGKKTDSGLLRRIIRLLNSKG